MRNYTDSLTAREMGSVVSDMKKRSQDSRARFERRWYDNNFFDDGFHFRFMSRQANKIVDLSDKATIYSPMRALPKASRQIRGIANLLVSSNPTPIVYPEKVNASAYPPIPTPQLDPMTGQEVMMEAPNPEYGQALAEAKRVAKASGHWLMEEWKEQNMLEKLAFMTILTAKHSVSYIQIWPDAVQEKIKTKVYDAFDIYLMGNLNELADQPFTGKATPRLIAEIKADERFDPKARLQISPDNRLASSEIKEAYEKARFGGVGNPELAATVIENEWFVQEYLNKDNMARIRLQENADDLLVRFKEGDPIIRQTFVVGDITMKDEYLNLPTYPFVDLRLEPGPMYQVPQIERFIPANKSLDLIASRVERFTNTMVTGSWSKRKGEALEISNTAAGQVLEYATTPPIQNQIAPIPPFVFNFMSFLEKQIEEQGVTTSTLGKIPAGVKANSAIESLKESELANLIIANKRVQGACKRICERMLDLADSYFVTPQTTYLLEKGEPAYFDVIGGSAMKKLQDLKVEMPEGVVPLKRDYRVEIEIEQGLAYSREGQKAAAKELLDAFIQLTQIGLISPEVIKVFMEKFLDLYGFGATQEIMDAIDQYGAQGYMGDQQVDATKVAVAEVMADLQNAGVLPTAEQRITEGKIATAEAVQDVADAKGK